MSNPKSRKSCVVPMCSNTTTKAPEKLFFIVPMEPKSRKKWMQMMKRADPPGARSCVYCCEDHFDIENDMESYVKYKLVGGRIKLKKGVVPHKFECQNQINEKLEKTALHIRNQIKTQHQELEKETLKMEIEVESEQIGGTVEVPVITEVPIVKVENESATAEVSEQEREGQKQKYKRKKQFPEVEIVGSLESRTLRVRPEALPAPVKEKKAKKGKRVSTESHSNCSQGLTDDACDADRLIIDETYDGDEQNETKHGGNVGEQNEETVEEEVSELMKNWRPPKINKKARENQRKQIEHSLKERANCADIIARVYHYLEREYEYIKSHVKCDLSLLSNILKRTSEATGVSERRVKNILKQEEWRLQKLREETNYHLQVWTRLKRQEQREKAKAKLLKERQNLKNMQHKTNQNTLSKMTNKKINSETLLKIRCETSEVTNKNGSPVNYVDETSSAVNSILNNSEPSSEVTNGNRSSAINYIISNSEPSSEVTPVVLSEPCSAMIATETETVKVEVFDDEYNDLTIGNLVDRGTFNSQHGSVGRDIMHLEDKNEPGLEKPTEVPLNPRLQKLLVAKDSMEISSTNIELSKSDYTGTPAASRQLILQIEPITISNVDQEDSLLHTNTDPVKPEPMDITSATEIYKLPDASSAQGNSTIYLEGAFKMNVAVEENSAKLN